MNSKKFFEEVTGLKPNNEAAYFTGEGLLSINIAVCKGCKILSNFSESLKLLEQEL